MGAVAARHARSVLTGVQADRRHRAGGRGAGADLRLAAVTAASADDGAASAATPGAPMTAERTDASRRGSPTWTDKEPGPDLARERDGP